jgi:hypothetical protein
VIILQGGYIVKDFVVQVDEILGKNKNSPDAKLFFYNSFLGMGAKEILSQNLVTADELRILNEQAPNRKKKTEKPPTAEQLITNRIESIRESLLFVIADMENNGFLANLKEIKVDKLLENYGLLIEKVTDEVKSKRGVVINLLAFAYYTYKNTYLNDLTKLKLETRGILKEQYNIPLLPLIYGDYNSTFRVNNQMKADIPITLDFKNNIWPLLLPFSDSLKKEDYYNVIVLAIGWDRFLRESVYENRNVWNGLLYRVTDYHAITGDEESILQSTLCLELTSYVALLGSNYGIFHSKEKELAWVADYNQRCDLADRLKTRWIDFSNMPKNEKQITSANQSQVAALISFLKREWPEEIETSLIQDIIGWMSDEKNNPFNIRVSKLANPLSVNLMVHGMYQNRDVMVIQRRNIKKVGHGFVSLQASAAGFVSPYLDSQRTGLNTSAPDIINAFKTETLQELGDIGYERIVIHGVFRDLINMEVGFSASANSAQIKINPSRELGNEVSAYELIPNMSANAFEFIYKTAKKENLVNSFDCMMPLGLSALLSYLASMEGWTRLFDKWVNIQKVLNERESDLAKKKEVFNEQKKN